MKTAYFLTDESVDLILSILKETQKRLSMEDSLEYGTEITDLIDLFNKRGVEEHINPYAKEEKAK